jgi:hypothetical protein
MNRPFEHRHAGRSIGEAIPVDQHSVTALDRSRLQSLHLEQQWCSVATAQKQQRTGE